MPACASGTFLFTAVPPFDLGRIASNAPNKSGRGGGTAVKFYELRDILHHTTRPRY